MSLQWHIVGTLAFWSRHESPSAWELACASCTSSQPERSGCVRVLSEFRCRALIARRLLGMQRVLPNHSFRAGENKIIGSR